MPASAYSTVTALGLAGLSVTTNCRSAEPLSPSVTLGDEIDSPEPSSLVIVPVPVAEAIEALEAPLSCTSTVSADSWSVSPLTATVTVFAVSPAANVSVPVASAV